MARDEPARRRLSRAESKARTRELLLDAAARTFARKGFAGASVEEIAEAAGFSIGALYSNFGGKEQLFLELLSARASGRLREAAQILEDPAVADPLGALSAQLVEVADKDVDFALLQAEFWLYAVRNPRLMDTLAEQQHDVQGALKDLVDREMRRRGHRIGVPGEHVAVVALALFQGLVRQRRVDPGSVPDGLYGQALRWLFAGLAAEAGSPEPDGEESR
ncbi:TetR/AcrR family transcriptional regulator [Gandjariella thermophila]|uniref:TetR family transcriptional regulator n=1 Tax=Gandjariella thermophila TaxID=1931992 RepID=A0A4D4J3E0_9PSEU|nr:TetR/AcrR family transcriptional regulator [Gandjariella thermophila]GDY31011.1 TetR family transcriptional regulator [Gandjariella thermophila]